MQHALQRHRLPNATKAATCLRVQRVSRALFSLSKLRVRTYRMRYKVWRMCSYAFRLFLRKKSLAVGKRKPRATKEQRTAQSACATTNSGRRAQRTAHFVAGRNRAAYIFQCFPVGCGLFTALWLARLM